jgi:hypothetical protein
MQPKESKSERHFIASMFKSILRIIVGVVFVLSDIPELRIGGIGLLAAEVLGIVEEF